MTTGAERTITRTTKTERGHRVMRSEFKQGGRGRLTVVAFYEAGRKAPYLVKKVEG